MSVQSYGIVDEDTIDADPDAVVVTRSEIVVTGLSFVVTALELGESERGGVENADALVVGTTDVGLVVVGPVAVGLDDKTDVGRTVTPPTSGNDVRGVVVTVVGTVT